MSEHPTFGTFGRYTEIPVDQMTPEQKKAYDLVVGERGEAPGPYNAEPLTAVQALSFSAVELFVKQVANSVHPFALTDADAPIVAEICRRLDGIALALELAASRVGAHGIRGVASLLDKHFRLLWRGRPTALPRHQTLSATLDWSYNLLSGTEQLVFRRVAIFVGGFSLAAALQVASEGLDPAELTEAVATLVDKSLVTSDGRSAARYRLLETTRAYAWQKLSESGEDQKIARRHCGQLTEALEEFGAQIWARPSPDSSCRNELRDSPESSSLEKSLYLRSWSA
jgi:predicted ATPase